MIILGNLVRIVNQHRCEPGRPGSHLKRLELEGFRSGIRVRELNGVVYPAVSCQVKEQILFWPSGLNVGGCVLQNGIKSLKLRHAVEIQWPGARPIEAEKTQRTPRVLGKNPKIIIYTQCCLCSAGDPRRRRSNALLATDSDFGRTSQASR